MEAYCVILDTGASPDANRAVRKAVVAGAGLGGLVAAIALRKQGIDVRIHEKARELKPVGAGLSIAPNGLNALETVIPGVGKILKALGSETHVVTIRRSTGELVVTDRLTVQDRYNQPLLNIQWSSLQESLASCLPADLIHLNNRLIGFDQDDSQVEIHFDQAPSVTADLLIGADGIGSTVRNILIGDGPPRYAGRMSWRAVIPNDDPKLPANEATIMSGPEGRVFTLFDVGAGCIFWSAAALSPESPAETTTVKHRVQQAFASWAPPVPAILEATAPEAIVERPITDRLPLSRWSHGRVTLLGDAAHGMVPALGQGANTAFEDAIELAQCLARTSDLSAALSRYDASRIYRTRVIQARSAQQGGRSYQPDGEKFLRGAMDRANASQSEFEDWLYRYNPAEPV
jgi:salicylate hydroxylase